jgi:hypothetical protein
MHFTTFRVLLPVGLIYICVATSLWLLWGAGSNPEVFKNRLVLELASYWWLIVPMPLTIGTAILRLQFRFAAAWLAAWVGVEFSTWMAFTMYQAGAANRNHVGTPLSLAIPLVFLALTAVGFSIVNMAVQILIFWLLRKPLDFLRRTSTGPFSA